MGPGTLLQCLLTSALAIASALETVHVNDLGVYLALTRFGIYKASRMPGGWPVV